MSAKHTPGPWRAENSCVICPDDSIVACCVRGSVDRKNQAEDWATARLIAAAPELLAALKYMLEVCPAINNQGEEAHCKARSAIDKATGDQS